MFLTSGVEKSTGGFQKHQIYTKIIKNGIQKHQKSQSKIVKLKTKKVSKMVKFLKLSLVRT